MTNSPIAKTSQVMYTMIIDGKTNLKGKKDFIVLLYFDHYTNKYRGTSKCRHVWDQQNVS